MEVSKTLKKATSKQKKYRPILNIFELFGVSKIPYSMKISFVALINYWQDKLKTGNRVEQMIARKINTELKKAPELLEGPIEDIENLNKYEVLIELLTSVFIPFQDEENFIRLSGPFNMLPFYHSPALAQILKTPSMSVNLDKKAAQILQFTTYRIGCLILNQFYGQELQLDPPYVFSIRDENTSLEKHFKIVIDSRFVEVKLVKPLEKLSDSQIRQLHSNVQNVDLWLKYLPPANFEIHGVIATFLNDITLNETLSRIKDRLLKKDALVKTDNIEMLEAKMSSIFNQRKLKLGIYALDYPKLEKPTIKYGINKGILSHKFSSILSKKYHGSVYEMACIKKEPIIIEDISSIKKHTALETELVKIGVQSIIIAPLLKKNNDVIGLIEIASPNAFALNSVSAISLKAILPLFNVAMERSREEIDNQIEAIIKERFTSIHPSVEWAFIEKASQIFNTQNEDTESLELTEGFVFRNNYPLYGQADIVASTVTRNRAIQADLIDNLYWIKKVLKKSIECQPFPLADQMLMEIDAYSRAIKQGASSANENRITEFIKNDIHPLFRQLRKRHEGIKEIQKAYFEYLDPQLGIVYRKRKDYETSVTTINKKISEYLDNQQITTQEMIPHYYEKFQTDGVAYNIYIGQSLLKKGHFDNVHLRNLRLWQLISMCEITQMMHKLKPQLPVPLDTAQLILVHSTPLSIRFRMDEKRFDVDGAYNARYEIIKKRIDKAIIEGTNERLTVAGKIAIVYQFDKDKKEYLRYLKYLLKKGLIEKNIEDLSLKKLQGTQGLKALRITVKEPST